MSAWIVSEAHIDLLVRGLVETEIVAEDPDKVGQALWDENYASVNYRYDENDPTPVYRYRRPEIGALDLGVLTRQVYCYDYQSCETPEYQTSTVKGWIDTLIANLERAGYTHDHPAVKAAPWGI